jgi:hypothetical protein
MLRLTSAANNDIKIMRRLVLLVFLCATALPSVAQFSLTIRHVIEQSSPAQLSGSSLQQQTLSYKQPHLAEENLPYPWNPRFQPSRTLIGESLSSASLSPPSAGATNGAYSLVVQTNIIEITAAPLFPEKLYQLLVASDVAGPYVPEGEVVEALGWSNTWVTTNSNSLGFYQVQEINSPCPPSVQITSPSDGSEVTSSDNIVISASAMACPSNRLVRAVLFDNDNKVGWLTSSETNLTNLAFEVSTPHLAPGRHAFRVMVEDDGLPESGENGYVAYSAPISVIVSNPVWFSTGEAIYDSEFFPVATDSIYVSWSSAIEDVRVRTEIRNPNGDLFWEWNEDVLPGSTVDGPVHFTAGPSFTDGGGNPIHAPDAFYDVTLIVSPIPTQGFAQANDPLFPPIVKRFYTEYEMPSTTNAEAIVAFQVTFDTNAASLGPQAVADLDAIRQTFSLVYSNPLPGAASEAYPMSSGANWALFLNRLSNWKCRTLVYVGHGSENSIGTTGEGMLASILRKRLGNMAPWDGTTNIQPYRAALLFGCDTAKPSGHVLEAFLGIKQTEPKAPHTRYTLFDFHGMAPRAGLGFTGYKTGFHDIGGVIFPHKELYEGADQLTDAWSQRLPGGLFARDLAGAVSFSRFIRSSTGVVTGVKNPAANNERIVGDDRLTFQ